MWLHARLATQSGYQALISAAGAWEMETLLQAHCAVLARKLPLCVLMVAEQRWPHQDAAQLVEERWVLDFAHKHCWEPLCRRKALVAADTGSLQCIPVGRRTQKGRRARQNGKLTTMLEGSPLCPLMAKQGLGQGPVEQPLAQSAVPKLLVLLSWWAILAEIFSLAAE